MAKNKSASLLIMLLIVLYSCKEVEVPSSESSRALYVDSVAPTVSSSPAIMMNIASITFSEAMDTSTVTVNTTDQTCSGSFQISKDDFITCIQMTGNPYTADKKTYWVTPGQNLECPKTYKLKITNEAKDIEGNPLAAVYSGSFACIDSTTNLMWQDNDYQTKHNWDNAISYCDNLTLAGYSDWQLPSKDELFDLYARRTILKSYVSSYYWSSTPYAGHTYYAWRVDFSNGYLYSNNKSDSYYVRCVRGEQ